MSQNDFNIANQGFPATRADINSALQALASNSAGTAEPSTTYAYQFWYDETNELLKMRNSDNDAWITIGTFDQAADTFTAADASVDKIEEGNSSVEVVDTGTGSIIIIVDGAEAARVDASRNLLVGKTSVNFNSAGFQSASSGVTGATASAASPFFVNRITDDGELATFYKSGSKVGGIGYVSSGLYIDGEASHSGFRFGGLDVTPRRNGADVDATIQLGTSVNRFSDLYLSGGVYLGGTGAANYLDDYEEGTWTPRLRGGTTEPASLLTGVGRYVKVGDLVTAYFSFENVNTTGYVGDTSVDQLPFTSAAQRTVGSAGAFNAVTWTGTLILEIPSSNTKCGFMAVVSGSGWNAAQHSAGTTRYLWGNFSYRIS